MHDDQSNRLYAANLLNRAGIAFDARDVGVVAKVMAVLEADAGDRLKRYADEIDTFHSVAGGFVRNAADLIAEGKHRPDLPQPHPLAASFESNVK